MSAQPEALRLADVSRLSRHHEWHLQVDAELRRQHEEITQLRHGAAATNLCIVGLVSRRDALLEALKLAWPIIEAEMYKQNCSYGKNFSQTKADRARAAHEKARAAISAVEKKHD